MKMGQDHEPNLPSLLVRIKLTVFDLAGGLEEKSMSWSEGGQKEEMIFLNLVTNNANWPREMFFTWTK